jgi:hypothetical protein
MILLFCMAFLCGGMLAQTNKTVTIRVLDGKTGKPLLASGYLVRIDREQTVHANWAVENEDGTGKLTLPATAALFSIRATYDESTQTYVNCDSSTASALPVDRWYSISEILASGIVVSNNCGKPSDAAKIKPVAKPGELVVLVRRMSTQEQWRE